MFDERERLRELPALVQLLTHYVEAGAADREAWQDRLMTLDDLPPRQLTELHGELIAYGWIEQNTGTTVLRQPGVVAACYRATAAGRRVLRQFHEGWDDDEETAEAA
jgi:hypothetical protein